MPNLYPYIHILVAYDDHVELSTFTDSMVALAYKAKVKSGLADARIIAYVTDDKNVSYEIDKDDNIWLPEYALFRQHLDELKVRIRYAIVGGE